MQIIFIRHGETYCNKEHRYSGEYDSVLTSKGENQSYTAYKYILDNYAFDKIITSDRQRAMYIGELIKQDTAQTYIVDNRISEYNFGIFEQKTYDEVMVANANIFDSWIKDETFQIPEGESKQNFEKRVIDFLKEILESKFENILCITHAGVIQTAITYLLKLPKEASWSFKVPNGGVAIIEIGQGYNYLTKFGEIEESKKNV